MIKYKVSGTLGDAYTIVCKLCDLNDDIIIYHNTVHTNWYNKIKEIYSLLPNITVRFNDIRSDGVGQLQSEPALSDTVFFPNIGLRDRNLSDEEYIVVQSHAGRDGDAMSRYLTVNDINKIIEKFHPISVKLIGTLPIYKDIKNCENLVKKTSLYEAMELTANASGYVGPEGLFTFVALSHRVSSIIFYPREQVINTRIKNLPWEEYVVSFIKM